MASRRCLICNSSFSGRRDAKTCSARCRKRLQKVRFSFDSGHPVKRLTKMAAIFAIGLFGALSILLSLGTPRASAATNNYINFQARLLTSSGAVVPDGNYNIDFRIYTADSTTSPTVGTCNGACVWEETHKNFNSQGVKVVNGYLSVQFGLITALPTTINWDQQLWLTMNITTNGTMATNPNNTTDWNGEMQNATHSIALTGVPYAFKAGSLASFNGTQTGTLSFGAVTNTPVLTLPNESGTICSTGSVCSGYAPSSGSGSYVQLQGSTPGTAQTGSFNISGGGTGTGIASTLQATTFDTASGVNLSLGQTNATAINIGKTTSNITTTVNGLFVYKPTTGHDSTTAFQIQNADASNTLFRADTSNSKIIINATGLTGAYLYNFDNNILGIGPSAYIESSLAVSGSGFTEANKITTLGSNSSSSTPLYVKGYAGGQSSDLLQVAAYATPYGSQQVVFGVSDNGDIYNRGINDSTTALQIQNTSSKAILTVDAAGGQALLGNTGSGGVNGKLVFNSATAGNYTVTLVASGSQSASYSLTLPTAAPTGSGQCLQTSGSATQLAFGSCGSGGSGLAKNATDTSSADAGSGYLYGFTNSGSAGIGGVLSLTNGTNTSNGLYVTASGNPASGKALIFASDTNASPAGNLIDLQSGSSPTSKFSVSAAGAVAAASTVTGTILNGTTGINTGSGSGIQRIDSSGNLVGIGNITGVGAITLQPAAATALTITGHAASTWSTDSGNLTIQAATTNTLALDTGGAGTVNLGTGNATTVSVGTSTAGTSATVNINNTTNAGTIAMGAGMTTGTISIGGASQTGTITLGKATTNQTIYIGNAQTAAGNTNTIQIGTSATGTGLAAISIGNSNGASSMTLESGSGTLAIGNGNTAHTIAIGTGGTSTIQGITIGSASNTTSALALQGGNNSATAILMQTGNNGSTTAGGITIGNTTGAYTQAINIGTNTTASSTTNVLIGSTIAGSTQIQSASGLILGKSSTANGNGTLVFDNAAGANTVSLKLNANPVSSYTLYLPTTLPTNGQCLASTGAGSPFQLAFATCGTGTGVNTVGAFSGSSQTNGATISGGTTITFGPADTTNPGMVSTGTQSFAGAKTFRSDSTTALRVQNAAGTTTLLTANTTDSNVTIQGNNSIAVFGSNLISSTPTCTPNTVTWTGTAPGWGPYAHVVGNTTNLSCTPPASVTAGETYQIVFTITSRTAGTVTPNIGGSDGTTMDDNDNNQTQTISYVSGTGNLIFKPSTDFDGAITLVSVKHFDNGANSVLNLANSDGSVGLELRAGGSGLDNSFVGYGSGYSNTTGAYNAVLGSYALQSNTTGSNNSVVGYGALNSNTTGSWNTAVGTLSLGINTTGIENSAFGGEALRFNTIGYANAAVGYGALTNNTSGSYNDAFGHYALTANTTGSSNIAIGQVALQTNTTGSFNTATGISSLEYNINGSDNTAYGEYSLRGNSSGGSNVAVGAGALSQNATGSYNTAIGADAGTSDSDSFVTLSNLQNATMIGANAQAQASNSLILGGAGANAVNVGIGTTNPANLFSVSPVVYSTGTAYQSTTTITGVGTTWTSSMVGMEFIFYSGEKETITGYTSPTSLTGSVSQTVSSNPGDGYRIHNRAFYVSSTGSVSMRSSTDSTTALNVLNSSGNSVMSVDTTKANANNMIASPSFESSTPPTAPANWSVLVGSTITSVATPVYEGSKAMQVATTTTANSGASYTTGASFLTTAHTYGLSMYVYDSSIAFGNATTFELGYSQDGSTNTACATGLTLNPKAWTKVTCSFTTGSVSGTPFIYLRKTGSGTNTNYTFVADEVLLQDTSVSSDSNYRNGAVNLTGALINSPMILQANANSSTAFQVQNAAGGTVFNVSTADENLISNPSFEVDTSGWSLKSASTMTRDTSQKKYGNASLKVVTTAASQGVRYTFPTGIVGSASSFMFSFEMFNNAGAAFSAIPVVGYNTGSDTNCAAVTPATVPSLNGWTRYTAACTAITGTISSIYVQTSASDSAARTFNIDAVQFEFGAVASEYGLGQISLSGVVNTPLMLRNQQNSDQALLVQNAAGANLFNIDTLNTKVYLGITDATATAGTVYIGTGTGAIQTVNIGSNSNLANVTNIYGGNSTAAIALTPQITGTIVIGAAAGTGNITLGSSSTTQTTIIGGGGGISTVQIAGGSAANVVNIANVQTAGSFSVGNGMTTGTISLGGASTTGAITVGKSTTSETIAIGNIAAAAGATHTISIGAAGTSTTGITAITIGNTNTSTGSSTVTIKAGSSTTGSLGPAMTLSPTLSTAVCSTLANGTAPTAGTAYNIGDCSTGPSLDYAEMYPTSTDSDYGDIMVTSSEVMQVLSTDGYKVLPDAPKRNVVRLVKSDAAYQSNVVGVMSLNYGDFSSTGIDAVNPADNPKPIALSGHIPVKISLSSAPIAVGDYITTSNDPGKGMKALQAGEVIGKALEAWEPNSGKATIEMYVEQGYYPGPNPMQTMQDAINAYLANNSSLSVDSITVAGTAKAQTLEIAGTATIGNLVVAGSGIMNDLSVKNLLTTQNLIVSGNATFDQATFNQIAISGGLTLGASTEDPTSANIAHPITIRFKASKPITAGSVVVTDTAAGAGWVTTTTQAGNTKVVGVAATTAANAGDVLQVAINGTVKAALHGSATIGQLVRTSDTEGSIVAVDQPTSGEVVGKILGTPDQNNQVLILMTLQ